MSVRQSQSVLQLSADVLERIWQHAHNADPYEACGIVTSSERHVPIRNASPRALIAYQFDAAEQLEAWQDMRDNGETLKIIYHSHTNRDAMPSRTDHALAAYPDAWYVIVSTRTDETRAFRLVDGRLTEHPFELVPSISRA
jgi:proteasome lid subunit RPN8/RPN11